VNRALSQALLAPELDRGVAFDAAGNRVVWIESSQPRLAPSEVREHLAQGPDPRAEILAVLLRRRGLLEATFYNPDGSPERICGNALRCLASFVGSRRGCRCPVGTALGTVVSWTDFRGYGWAELPALALAVEYRSGGYWVDVGTPHWVEPVDDVLAPGVARLGEQRCTGERAVNATFFTVAPNGSLRVRTLERGVPAETRSCGTGALAAFLVARRTAPRRVGERALVGFASGEELEVLATSGGRRLAVGGRVSRELGGQQPVTGSPPPRCGTLPSRPVPS
jgi:diaminopimelate epimerase